MEVKQRQMIGEELETERLAPQLILANVASKLGSPALLQRVAESKEVQSLQRLVPPPSSLRSSMPRAERAYLRLTSYRPSCAFTSSANAI